MTASGGGGRFSSLVSSSGNRAGGWLCIGSIVIALVGGLIVRACSPPLDPEQLYEHETDRHAHPVARTP